MRKSAIDETPNRPTSNAGSPSRRSTQAGHQNQQHRVRKGSQSRRKSTCSSAAQSRSSTEPDVDFTSPRVSATPSIAGSPYSLAASFATISESGDFSTGLTSPYDSPGAVSMAAHHQQHQQHIPYSMPYHDCGYQSGAAWPVTYERDPSTSAGMSSSFISTVSNPNAFPVLTPPDEYMQFQAFSSLQTAGADIWPYHR
ncbi:hypothetical protein V2A60_002662 [Cordyceps javanica]|nr:hypothetical protein IF2G_06461 [Cordyceps javanica]